MGRKGSLMNDFLDSMSEATATLVFFAILLVGIVGFNYTQRYVEDANGDTATKGVVFTRTLKLSKYEDIGEGSGLFGHYNIYTRSVIQGQGEHTKVYTK